MKIWECEIVEKEGDQYKTLKADGWEPHQFTLIPVPKEAQIPGGLLTANGQNMGASFVQIVMMRKQFDNPIDWAESGKFESGAAPVHMAGDLDAYTKNCAGCGGDLMVKNDKLQFTVVKVDDEHVYHGQCVPGQKEADAATYYHEHVEGVENDE